MCVYVPHAMYIDYLKITYSRSGESYLVVKSQLVDI